jgi:hypothetical protein
MPHKVDDTPSTVHLLLCSSTPLLLCSSAPLLLCSSAPLLLCSFRAYSLSPCVVTTPSSSISHLYKSLLSAETTSSAAAGAVAAKPLMILYSWVMTPKQPTLAYLPSVSSYPQYEYRRARCMEPTPSLPYSLFALLHNVIRRLVRPADNNGPVWCGSHDQGSEEGDQDGEECGAHYSRRLF